MIRNIGVKGLRTGNVMLEARLGAGGPVWAFTQVIVAATDAAATDNAFDDAVRTKQLVFNNPADLRLIDDISAGKETNIKIGSELQSLLATLAKSGKVVVMSLYRRGQGPHGMVQPDGTVICRGVDITGYAGVPVSLTNSGFAIDVVSNLIAHFPPARFDLGFPRPVGGNGPTNFNPAQDVFFSVPDKAAGDLCFLGKAVHPLNAMLEPARSRVQQAMVRSGARFPVLFADGLNHLHVKAY